MHALTRLLKQGTARVSRAYVPRARLVPAALPASTPTSLRNGLCGVQGGASGIRGREADRAGISSIDACIVHTSSGDVRSSK